MQEEPPTIDTAFRHVDWDITFVVRAYRKVSKVEAAAVVRRFLLRQKGKPLKRGSRIIIASGQR